MRSEPENRIHISLLRGINVIGHNVVKMDALGRMFAKLGLGDVRTYIQSGNVIFRADEVKRSDLEIMIRRKILDEFGFDVPVIVRRLGELERMLVSNPFEGKYEIASLYATFLSEVPGESSIAGIEDFRPADDKFIISGTTVFLHCPDGYGNTKLTNTFFEKKLKVAATTRNWRTTGKLVEIAQDLANMSSL